MSVETVIRYCAPTLAGMKVGSLFSLRFSSKEELLHHVKVRNDHLNCRGIYFKILKLCGNFALIYVYRRKKLLETLQNPELQDFLKVYGYTDLDLDSVFEKLENHLVTDQFPHEIGVFLDYPLSDIKAFIAHKGANAKYVGCWKAYTNEEQARKTTEKYKKCTNIYCKRYAEGIDLIRLTVAC